MPHTIIIYRKMTALWQHFDLFLIIMSALAAVVFVCLFFIDAGYGKFYTKKWGPAISNKTGWVLMESPVFIAMLVLCLWSERRDELTRLVFLIIFETHYFHRAFIFPSRISGESKMPFSIIFMGMIFNTANAFMQGGWIFYVSPEGMYGPQWLLSPQFIAGLLLFVAGMAINIQSDNIIRNLRKPGDTRHYLPKGGMFRYVTSANYFGEFLEWVGFALLTWSWAGAVFALWTFANLCPRAARIYEKYRRDFPDEFDATRLKRIIPFIY